LTDPTRRRFAAVPSQQPVRGAPRRTPEATERLRAGLQRAGTAIIEAELAERPSERFLAAHSAALQVAAVVLALRTSPAARGQRSRPRNAWRMVADVAPELGEWAGFFAATEAKRDAVRAGAVSIVGSREADDLVRDARAFLSLVERSVG
jgi:hypothetical protein